MNREYRPETSAKGRIGKLQETIFYNKIKKSDLKVPITSILMFDWEIFITKLYHWYLNGIL